MSVVALNYQENDKLMTNFIQRPIDEQQQIAEQQEQEMQIQMEQVIQGGHDTGKTGNLTINFSRQGKHREFRHNMGKFLTTGNLPNFPKI